MLKYKHFYEIQMCFKNINQYTDSTKKFKKSNNINNAIIYVTLSIFTLIHVLNLGLKKHI